MMTGGVMRAYVTSPLQRHGLPSSVARSAAVQPLSRPASIPRASGIRPSFRGWGRPSLAERGESVRAKAAGSNASAQVLTELEFKEWLQEVMKPPPSSRGYYPGMMPSMTGTDGSYPDSSVWTHGISDEALHTSRRYLAACIMEEPELAPEVCVGASWALDALVRAMAQGGHAAELESSPHMLMAVSRLAAWVPSGAWVRPLEEWEPPAKGAAWEEAVRSVAAHLLELYPVPAGLQGALAHSDADVAAVSEAAQRVSRAFLRVHAAAGGGASMHGALQEHVDPSVTKKMAAALASADDGESSNPLHAFRLAQMRALDCEGWVAEAILESDVGSRIAVGGGEGGLDEEYVATVLLWMAANGEELRNPGTATAVVNYFCEMRRIKGGAFKVAGRTVKKVLEAFEEYELSSLRFEDDERFEPNPRGIRGLWEEGAVIPPGTKVEVPYDGPTTFDEGTQPALVRVTEILSLKRLIYEGEMLGNCLENKYRSQVKYLSRIRRRTSSYWSLTIQPGGGEVEFELLIEVWHERGESVIHQAESKRPRTLPTARAWYWLDKWCEREGLNLRHWDCYSDWGGGWY